MIYDKTLEIYECKTIKDYYQICIDSLINGNISQLREQLRKMSKDQQKDFMFQLIDEKDRGTNERMLLYIIDVI